jgi:hypothetical protein
MGNSTNQTTGNGIVKTFRTTKSVKCLACGSFLKKPRRRYCSDGCHQKINWVLSLSKGLLKTFNTRYAAFSFTDCHVMLDVLPAWSNVISRFVCERKVGNKPAEDLKYLVLQSGKEWHELIDNRKSKSYASLVLLDKSHNRDIDPASIKPNRNTRPRLSDEEKNCLKVLCIKKEDLCLDAHTVKINSAYRKMAKVYHPDMGGDEEKFKQLNEAHKQMLAWAENPLFVSRKALHDCWSYDASTNRWSPPL